MDESEALSAFAALSQDTRLRLIRALVTAGPEGMAAGALAQAVGAAPSRASFHLAALAEAGLVTSERQARVILYRVNFAQIGALARYLLEDCCQGNAEARSCCSL